MFEASEEALKRLRASGVDDPTLMSICLYRKGRRMMHPSQLKPVDALFRSVVVKLESVAKPDTASLQ